MSASGSFSVKALRIPELVRVYQRWVELCSPIHSLHVTQLSLRLRQSPDGFLKNAAIFLGSLVTQNPPERASSSFEEMKLSSTYARKLTRSAHGQVNQVVHGRDVAQDRKRGAAAFRRSNEMKGNAT